MNIICQVKTNVETKCSSSVWLWNAHNLCNEFML